MQIINIIITTKTLFYFVPATPMISPILRVVRVVSTTSEDITDS